MMDWTLDIQERHRCAIIDAASRLIGVADDTGVSLVDVIGEMERFVVHGIKVGDAAAKPVPTGRRGYTIVRGRLVEVTP